MTQQYIVGEFSSLLGDLQPACGEWLVAVKDLRRRVEASPAWTLGPLAREAIELPDPICLAALEQGDVDAFLRAATTAVVLREFVESAGLLE